MKMIYFNTLEHRLFPIPFYVLTISGVWCPDDLKSYIKPVYTLFTYIIVITNGLLVAAIIIYMGQKLLKREFSLNAFYVFTSVTVSLCKGLNILLQRENLLNLIRASFKHLWRLQDHEKTIIANNSSNGRRIQMVYTILFALGVSIKLLYPMTNADRQLPAFAWYPYNIDEPLYFWVSYAHQIFVGTGTLLMHIGADTLLSGFLLQLCIQLKLLKYRFEHFYQLSQQLNHHSCSPSIRTKIEKKMMNECIDIHQYIYNLSDRINNSLSGLLAFLLSVAIPNVCIMVYTLATTEIKLNFHIICSCILLTVALIQIFLPCWYGNEIVCHSLDIQSAIYKMDWINITSNTRKTLTIIMMRASKPIQIVVTRIFPINVQTFISILKLSYSTSSVLRRI